LNFNAEKKNFFCTDLKGRCCRLSLKIMLYMNQNPVKSTIVLFYYEFSKLKPATYRRKVVLNELFSWILNHTLFGGFPSRALTQV
jgi:hypothetical protein